FFIFRFFCMLRPPPCSPLFPTRRSSDLYLMRFLHSVAAFALIFSQTAIAAPATETSAQPKTQYVLISFDGAHDNALWARSREFRSEEHTSELQSRENLVCRLLLEKKNTN